MGDLNVFQQVCVQVFTANLVGWFIGTEEHLQKALNSAANHAINTYLGQYGWKITWGPWVFKAPQANPAFSGPTSCWMISMAPGVVYPDGSKYDTDVVAIAGTATYSGTDWAQEDAGVDNRTFKDGPIPEPQKTPKPPGAGPFCAWGTAWGTYNLVTNTSPAGNPGENTTILRYLAGLNNNGGNFRVIFTGHSLGGALSPFLSLAVKANALIPALAGTPGNILTFPAAGATPGDGKLRDAYSRLFPPCGPGGYQLWNADLYNSIDIVPQAWSTDPTNNDRVLDKIVGIYGKLDWIDSAAIQTAVHMAKDRAGASGITYEPIEGNPFTSSCPPATPPSSVLAFIAEAVKQHIVAYHEEVGIGDIPAEAYAIAAGPDGVSKKTAKQAAASLPVLDLLPADAVEDVPEGFMGGGDGKGVPLKYPYDCILG